MRLSLPPDHTRKSPRNPLPCIAAIIGTAEAPVAAAMCHALTFVAGAIPPLDHCTARPRTQRPFPIQPNATRERAMDRAKWSMPPLWTERPAHHEPATLKFVFELDFDDFSLDFGPILNWIWAWIWTTCRSLFKVRLESNLFPIWILLTYKSGSIFPIKDT